MSERTLRHQGRRYRLEHGHADDIAVVLLAFDPDGQLAGKARAVRHRTEPDAAEVVLTLAHPDRDRGLDVKLLRALQTEARHAGVRRLTGQVALDDAHGQGLLVAVGAACWLAEPGVVAFELPLGRHTLSPEVARQRAYLRLAS